MKKKSSQVLNSSFSMQENSEQENGHSLVLVQRKKVLCQWRWSSKWMGQHGRKDDVDIRRKQTPSFPIHESIVERSAQKQRQWEIVDPLLCQSRHDYNFFSHNYFCKSTQFFAEQSRKYVKTMNFQKIERANPLWDDSRVFHSCQEWSRQTCLWTVMTSLTKIFHWRNTENELKSWSQQDKIEQILCGCKILECCWNQTIFHDRGHWRCFHNFFEPVECREYTSPRETKHLNRKIGFEWMPKLGPCWRSQLVAYKVNIELRLESSHEQGPFSLVNQNFSWLIQVGHEFEQQRTGNLRNAGRKKCVQIEWQVISQADAKPQKRDSASSSTRTSPINQKTGTNVEPREHSISDHVWSVKKIDSSMERLNSGEQKIFFKNISCVVIIGMMTNGRTGWQGRTNKNTFQCFAGSSRAILDLRLFQGHSGRNHIDPSLQDNLSMPNNFFKCISHV